MTSLLDIPSPVLPNQRRLGTAQSRSSHAQRAERSIDKRVDELVESELTVRRIHVPIRLARQASLGVLRGTRGSGMARTADTIWFSCSQRLFDQ